MNDRQFLVFSLALMAGQAAGSIEAFTAGSYGTAVSQLYFLLFTAWGAVRRAVGSRHPAVEPNANDEPPRASVTPGQPIARGWTG